MSDAAFATSPDEYVLALDAVSYVQVGNEGLVQWRDGKKSLLLNETANLIVSMLRDQAADTNRIVGEVMRVYDADEKTARVDVIEFLEMLGREGLLTRKSARQSTKEEEVYHGKSQEEESAARLQEAADH